MSEWARLLPGPGMVSEKLDRSVAIEHVDAETATAEPGLCSTKTTSLHQVVRRHKHIQCVLQHPSQAAVPAEERVVTTAAAKSIVVVDDERDQVDLTVMMLKAAGHNAHGTTDGRLALDLILLHAADLLLVDFMMPNMNGGAVCEALRAFPTKGLTKIVMISGTPEDVVRAEFEGYEVFLQKPVYFDRLLRTVEDL